MVCKIIFCSKFPHILDKADKKKQEEKQPIAKRYAFHANAINSTNKGVLEVTNEANGEKILLNFYACD